MNCTRRGADSAPVIACRWLVIPILLGASGMELRAQTFEGAVTMRELSVESASLATILAGQPDSLSRLSLLDLKALAEAVGDQAEAAELTYYLSGSRLRTVPQDDSTGAAEFLIADFAVGLYRVVDPDQRLIVEWRGRAAGDDAAVGEATSVEPSITRIPGTRDVNGFVCNGWLLRYGTAIVEVSWLTDELADLAQAFARLALLSQELGTNGESDRSLSTLLARGFPIHTTTADAESGVVSAAEIVQVERRSLPADTFDPPADYVTVTVER